MDIWGIQTNYALTYERTIIKVLLSGKNLQLQTRKVIRILRDFRTNDGFAASFETFFGENIFWKKV